MVRTAGSVFLMSSFETHHLRVTLQVETPVRLGPYKGAAIRGALLNALRRHYCSAPVLSSRDTAWEAHITHCPACRLVAAEDEARERGRNLPRSYVINPPLEEKTRYQPGDRLVFGLGLFAEAAALYPFVLSALSMLGQEGIGHRLAENEGQRGRISLLAIEAVNPLTHVRCELMRAGTARASSALPLPVTYELAEREAERWPADRLTVRLLTPTYLVTRGEAVRRLAFDPFVKRLIERFIDLWTIYGEGEAPADRDDLVQQASCITVLSEDTQWVHTSSWSRRTGRKVPTGGLVGTATFAGDFRPLLPWLLWGQGIHVGKNAVKGNGWYELLP